MADSSPRCGALRAFYVPLRYALPALFVLAVLAAFPAIDIAVTESVYAVEYGGFYLGRNVLLDMLGHVTSLSSAVFVAGCFGWWLVVQRRFAVQWRINNRLMAYIALVFIVGPVLVVSFGFKEHWGRERPHDVVEFGGAGTFTPYYSPEGVCESDCSFPSGHSSRGFYFMALAIAAYGLGWQQRRVILAGAIGFGVMTATLRILEGRHFLSDVTLSAVIVTYISWVLFRLIFPPETRDAQ